MSLHPNIALAASLIADPARAVMLYALLDGRALPAGELAYAASVTAQTASSHLAKLCDGGLLVRESEGRHRYYRLAGPHVAQAIEQLATIHPAVPARRKPLTRQARAICFARCCYDHLAGRLGVAVTDALEGRGFITGAEGKRFDVTPDGSAWFERTGVDMANLSPTRRGLARQCLDWTERRHHVAGPLGVALFAAMSRSGWMRRVQGERAVEVVPPGAIALRRELGIDVAAIRADAKYQA